MIREALRRLIGVNEINAAAARDAVIEAASLHRAIERELAKRLRDAERALGEYHSDASRRQVRIEGPADTFTWVEQPKQHEPATQYFLKYSGS